MPPPKVKQGKVCGNAVFILKTYAKKIGKGCVCSNDSGLLTPKKPDTVRGVDAMFFLTLVGARTILRTITGPDFSHMHHQ